MSLCKTLYALITVVLLQPRKTHPYMTETNANWEVKKQIKQTQSTYYLLNDFNSGQEKLK